MAEINIEEFVETLVNADPKPAFSYHLNIFHWDVTEIYEELLVIFTKLVKKVRDETVISIDDITPENIETVDKYFSSIGVKLNVEFYILPEDEEYINNNRQYKNLVSRPGIPLDSIKFTAFSPETRRVMKVFFGILEMADTTDDADSS